MNGPILTGVGIALVVWGVVALFYGQSIMGPLLIAAGLVLTVFGRRQPRK